MLQEIKKPKRKTPPKRQADTSEDRRSVIVQAALDEFVEKGFVAARMEDIARRAGIAKGTIYLRFRDKEALFEALIREELTPVVGVAQASPAPGESVRQFLERAFLPQFKDLHRSRLGRVLRLLIAEASRFPVLSDLYFRIVVTPGMQAFRKLAKRARDRGELKNLSLVRFPQLFVAPLVVGLLWSGLFERLEHLDVEAMLKAHLDELFASGRSGRERDRAK